jgi:hypothetical protein
MAHLLFSASKGGQQQGAPIIWTENIQLWHPFMAKDDTSGIFEMLQYCLFGMEISILELKSIQYCTLLNVFIIASHLVEQSEQQLTNLSGPIDICMCSAREAADLACSARPRCLAIRGVHF